MHHAAELPENIKARDFITFIIRLLKLPTTGEARAEIFAAVGIETINNTYIGKLNREERGEALLAVLPYFKKKVDTITAEMSLGFTIRINDIMRPGRSRYGGVVSDPGAGCESKGPLKF